MLGDPRLPDVTKVDHKFSPEDLEMVESLKAALAQLPDYDFQYWNNHSTLIEDLLRTPPEFVMNFCDTGFRNDATRELQIVAFLEMLDIPCTGAGPVALGLCYDKALVRALAASVGMPVPQEIYCEMDTTAAELPTVYPALIKPNTGDGSVGITAEAVVLSADEARIYLAKLRREWPGRDALIQEFLSGAEYGLALIGNPGHGFEALPLLEVDYSALPAGLPKILSYESKTIPDSPYWTDIKFRVAELGEAQLAKMVQGAQRLFERLGLRDYSRFDFRADRNGVIKLIEVNPNPAWCWDGKLNVMAGFAGYSYSDLLRLILEAAQKRAKANA